MKSCTLDMIECLQQQKTKLNVSHRKLLLSLDGRKSQLGNRSSIRRLNRIERYIERNLGFKLDELIECFVELFWEG